MSEPVRTPPFAPFEWLLSGRYLRARRKEGFISVIAGFSFLGIMLGVATLIIVMAVMNGFRKELLDKILGLNGHLLVQPLELPLTDWKDVADRISQVQASASRRPWWTARRWDPRRSTRPAYSSAASAPTISTTSPRLPRTSNRARWRVLTTGRASPSAAGSPISCRCMPATASRWCRRRARSPRWARRRASSPTRSSAVFEIGMSEYDSSFVFMPLTEAQAYFNRNNDVTAIEVFTDQSRQDRGIPQAGDRGRRAAGVSGRLAAAQFDLLQRASGRAQRDVPDPDHDRAGRGAQYRFGPDHAGQGQGQRYRDPAHHGRLAGLDHADLPDHRRLDRRGRHADRLFRRPGGLPQYRDRSGNSCPG